MTVQAITTELGYTYLKCDCDRTAIRIRTQSNGVRIYAEQCLDCGRQLRAVSKNSPEILEMPERVPFDTELATRWRERESALRQERIAAREAAQQEKNSEWWQRYTAYLQTTDWRLKRQAVMTRANNWCEGCRARNATQVHHLSYAHVFNEFLFELVAVCDTCHQRIHAETEAE